ncbi:MAG: hypothetical protein KC468_35370 [Myxococcales bacterium]|nr:hypothetical protein [Myxococcales bacterium]
MKTTATLTTLLLAAATTLTACDAAQPADERAAEALGNHDIEAIYVAVDAIDEQSETGESNEVARALEGPMSLAAPVDPTLGCGWEYPVCMSWCFANNISQACFSFCHSEFC